MIYYIAHSFIRLAMRSMMIRPLTTLTVEERGPVPMQDFRFLDDMAHFERERIAERVLHAKRAGM